MEKHILFVALLSILFSCQKKQTAAERQENIAKNVARAREAEKRELQKADAMHFLDSLEINDSVLYEDIYEIIKQNVIENAQ